MPPAIMKARNKSVNGGERIVHRLNFRMTVGQAHYGLAPCLNKGGYLQIVTHKGQISEM